MSSPSFTQCVLDRKFFVLFYRLKNQVIALIAHLRSKNVNGPFLVTAPLATLPNWVNEFRKWLPCVDVLLYHGNRERRQELRKTAMKPRMSRTASFPIVVTSYEVGLYAGIDALQQGTVSTTY